MTIRDLDSYYFRVNRDGNWQSVCFSDLTNKEMSEVGVGKSAQWWRDLACGLGKRLRALGDTLNVYIDDEGIHKGRGGTIRD